MSELTVAGQTTLPRAAARQASPTLVLTIVSSAVVMASLDLFIVNVALPSIARDFGERGLGPLSWILNGYAIAYASLLVLFGRVAERFRRDRAFLLGVAVFTAGSAACAAAPGVALLVTFRVVQAAGAALLTPTSLGLLLATYAPDRRHGAVRAWTAVGGLAAALGPVAGGVLVEASWRWVFLVNVPVGIAALVVGWRRLPAAPGVPVQRTDPSGVALATGAVGLLSLSLVEGGAWGWRSAGILASLAGSVTLLAGLVLHLARSKSPIVPPELFRTRAFSGASLVALLFSTAFGAMLLSLVLWEQGVWRWSALETGAALAPGPAMVPLVSFLAAGRLIRRFGSRWVMAAGCLLLAAGMASWTLAVTASPDYLSGILPGSLLNGIGVGLALPTMMATATSALPPDAFATGSGVVNMIRQTGIALGVAALVAVVGQGASGGSPLAAFRHGWWLGSAVALAAGVAAAGWVREGRA